MASGVGPATDQRRHLPAAELRRHGICNTSELSANWTQSPDESTLGLDADPVVHGTSNPLLAAEVALGRLN